MSETVLYEGQKGGSSSEPVQVDTPAQSVPKVDFDKRAVWPSKMFTIKLELKDFEAANPGVPTYDASQGDGGASLGGVPPEELAAALVKYLPKNCSTKYGDPVGRADVRKAIFENYYRFDSDTGLSPDSIVIGDGGRDILQKWYQLLVQDTASTGGNVVVSAAPWGSYTQGPYINCLNILCAPGSADNGFRITPEAIDACVERSNADKRGVAGLIITSPDNPTGNYIDLAEMAALIEHATARNIPHIFVDLVYQAVTDAEVGLYDINALYKGLSKEAKARVCFMDSLTKSAGGSNLRIAHLVAGNDSYFQRFKGIATHTVIPNAIGEAAALEVYGAENPLEHPWVKQVSIPTAQSRKIVQRRLKELGYRFIADQGYYAFINIWPWLGKQMPAGMTLPRPGSNAPTDVIEDVNMLKSYLTKYCGLAVIHGTVFKQSDFIRFSYANAPEYTDAALTRLHESLGALR